MTNIYKIKPVKSSFGGLLKGISSRRRSRYPWWFIVESDLKIWFWLYHYILWWFNSMHYWIAKEVTNCYEQIIKKAHECCFHLNLNCLNAFLILMILLDFSLTKHMICIQHCTLYAEKCRQYLVGFLVSSECFIPFPFLQ